jgi:hypothetical protein
MNKNFLTAFCLIFIMALPLIGQDFLYVGVGKCKTCHKKESSGQQFQIWEKSKHASAMKTLASKEALEIAAKKGIKNPATDAQCTKCHSTFAAVDAKMLDPKTKLTLDEGVSCESCHGPGSEYKSSKTMKNHDLAVKKGLIVPDEKVCKTCHNDKSPTFVSFDFKKYFDKIKHPVPKK